MLRVEIVLEGTVVLAVAMDQNVVMAKEEMVAQETKNRMFQAETLIGMGIKVEFLLQMDLEVLILEEVVILEERSKQTDEIHSMKLLTVIQNG